MKKTGSKKKKTWRNVTLVALAGVLVGGSFAFASGDISLSPDSLFAAVFSAWSGRPAIFISRDSSSPYGVISTGSSPKTIAVFAIGSRNVSYWATLQGLNINIYLSGNSAASLKLSQFALSYRYCIPAGVKYGYGYFGGQCATVTMPINSAMRNGNTYMLTVYSGTPIYPQSSGQLTLTAAAAYGVGGSATDAARMQVTVVSGNGSGDQCRAYTYNSSARSYGYSQCVPLQAYVYPAYSNALSVQRSYGYGYCLL